MSALCQKRTHALQQRESYWITLSARATRPAGTATPTASRLEINYQLKLRRLFHRNVGDLGSAEELNQLSGIKSAHDLSETRPVGSKAAFLSGFGPLIHSRQPLRRFCCGRLEMISDQPLIRKKPSRRAELCSISNEI